MHKVCTCLTRAKWSHEMAPQGGTLLGSPHHQARPRCSLGHPGPRAACLEESVPSSCPSANASDSASSQPQAWRCSWAYLDSTPHRRHPRLSKMRDSRHLQAFPHLRSPRGASAQDPLCCHASAGSPRHPAECLRFRSPPLETTAKVILLAPRD